MEIGLYLALTQGEFAAAPVLPGKPVWLGCRFSPEEGPLTGLPPAPSGAVMVNDSIPFPAAIRSGSFTPCISTPLPRP